MSENNTNCYEFDDYRLDVTNFQLLENGEPISLTQKSFELLHYLVEHRGKILKKEELLDSLWEGNYVEEANLTQHIYMLRKALKQQERKKIFIETIPKNGYRFLADVREFDEDCAHISRNGHASTHTTDEPYPIHSYRSGYLDENVNAAGFEAPGTTEKARISEQTGLSNRTLAVISVLSLILIPAAVYFYYVNFTKVTPGGAKHRSIAVLPFTQINGEKDEKLGIGIADVLIARLANIEEITVSPTTSILRFADVENPDLAEIGRKLDVEYVIAGVIQKENETVRVTTQLYDVSEKRQVWTQTIDERYSDIFTLQDRISEKVAQKISMGLDIGSSALPYRQYTKNIEAYQAYSMGLSYWTMHTRSGFENAIREFQKATERDPKFVLAYAYLADSYGHTSHIAHLLKPEEARAEGEAAAKRALALDPNCAEALAALALIYANQGKQTEAFGLMQRSIGLKPNDAHARHRIAWMYANQGRIERSVDEMRIAQKLDPQSVYINVFLGEMLNYAGKPDEAIVYFEKALEIKPNAVEANWNIARSLEQKGLYAEAEKELQKIRPELADNPELLLAISRLLARNDRPGEARKLLASVTRNTENDSHHFLIAQVLLALGENESALARLEKFIERVGDNIYVVKYEPNLAPIRNNPKFIELLRTKEAEQGW
jgi:DNA-binding winged helix-turn-helix (wHTH) protein/TolB-like protein/Tfp pilus assembly protein PilF